MKSPKHRQIIMKFATSFLFLLTGSANNMEQAQAQAQEDHRDLANLAEMWSIADPVFLYNGLDFTFDYPVSSFVDVGMAYYEVYDAGCKEGGNLVTTGFDFSPLVDVTPGSITDDANFDIAGDTAQACMGIDISTITSNSDVYSETNIDGGSGASIVFCVRFGLKTLGDSAVEVNFLESVITLSVNLSSGFSIDNFNVTPKDQVVNYTSSQTYTVEGYMCQQGTDTPVSDATTALSQGSFITVCIKPDADGIADGIKMRTIDSFDWTRDTITQAAVESGIAAGNLLTSFDEIACASGDYCQFSSILFAAFYATEGQVSGSGVASMQFGTISRRHLCTTTGGHSGLRVLQEQEAAATSPFDLSVSITAVDDGPIGYQTTTQTASGVTAGTMMTAVVSVISMIALLL